MGGGEPVGVYPGGGGGTSSVENIVVREREGWPPLCYHIVWVHSCMPLGVVWNTFWLYICDDLKYCLWHHANIVQM